MTLNHSTLTQALGEAVYLFDEIDSTNAWLLNEAARLENGALCCAETQTAGRGRRGRQWVSPPAGNLYFSLLWTLDRRELAGLSALSLALAVVIADVFADLGVELEVKWPNDLYYRGKKVSGMLIENKIQGEYAHLVIGIGINLSAQSAPADTPISQAWTDLSAFQLNREMLLIRLVTALRFALAEFPHTRFAPYLERWHELDHFYQQPVKLLMEQGECYGISRGVTEAGELILENDAGQHFFAIGEISLRAQ